MKSDRDTLVLVAIMNNRRDFEIAKNKHWYRIPVKSAPKQVREAAYLAFYQTKVFGEEKWAINYYAGIRRCMIVRRRDLLPDEGWHPRADEKYYRIEIGELQRLPRPIISKRWRRITFIRTTLEKFRRAEEVNDLFDESPLEDKLWYEFKESQVEAERQYYIGEDRERYCLDFAIFCKDGKIDVECDGDTWHTQKEAIPKDNARNNFLTSRGWSVLRFGSKDINENMPNCVAMVKYSINRLGGITTTDGRVRSFRVDHSEGPHQLELFADPT